MECSRRSEHCPACSADVRPPLSLPKQGAVEWRTSRSETRVGRRPGGHGSACPTVESGRSFDRKIDAERWVVETQAELNRGNVIDPRASVGKLIVAREVQRLSGYKLVHNHLTVNALAPVFDFGSDPFSEVLHRVRLDVFETAARHGTDLIFTNNSVWGNGSGGRHGFEDRRSAVLAVMIS